MWAKLLTIEARISALADANGIMRYIGADGNTYSLGAVRQHLAGNVTINQATSTPQGIMNSVALLSGVTYRVEGHFQGNQNPTTNTPQYFGWTGPATSFVRIFYQFANQTTNAVNAWTSVAALGGANALQWAPTAVSQVFHLYYHGTIVPSGNGPLTAFGACSNTANIFTMISGTFMDVSAE
jgi:hypothetical protein